MSQNGKSNEDTWLIHQKNDENLASLLQKALGRRNSGQLPPAKELRLPLRKSSENLENSENNLEQEVVCPKEGNFNNPESVQGDIEVAPPCQEREENSESIHEQEGAEPSPTRDLPTISLDNELEGGAVGRPQRVRRPPCMVRRLRHWRRIRTVACKQSGQQHALFDSSKYGSATTRATA